MIPNDTSYVAAFLVALCACSCSLDTGSGTKSHSPPAPAPVAAASPEAASIKHVTKTKLETHAAELESTGPTPSVETVAKVTALREHLDTLVSHVEGSRIAFVDCQGSSCGARLSASNIGQLQDMLRGISQDQEGRVGFVVRERLDPYLGGSYEADLTLDTDASRQVPEEAAELLQPAGE